ncbi:MAG: dephospho-CoA kinase [Planctomycetia bacterium]|nr:dephospho-CoA kinase [Planctomycetia bacterium]
MGLIGGVGSGKSSVARRFQAISHCPVVVIDADQLGHQVLQLPTVKERLLQRFGSTIFDSQGDITRSSLGRLVFGEDATVRQARHDLEAIVHPEIRKLAEQSIRDLRQQQQVELIVLDAALLLEAGWKDACDLVVFVDTPQAARIARVQTNRGWSAEELAKREASQWPLPRKRAAADAVIDNSNDVDDAATQLNQIIRQRFSAKVE